MNGKFNYKEEKYMKERKTEGKLDIMKKGKLRTEVSVDKVGD